MSRLGNCWDITAQNKLGIGSLNFNEEKGYVTKLYGTAFTLLCQMSVSFK